ncbi:TauD/TfdA dioxygenase family protein [Nocardia sp. NBC_01388]|uniref:TauD/TfdA dioxygenase family protein n=1 Tax=Nocardia sp. NBC_01388 TaxID=2903596 RepID=UPI003254130A
METTAKTADVGHRMIQPSRLDGYPLIVGPFTHVAAERDRLSALRWQHLEARQVGASIGAEISGVDLTAPLAAEVIAEIRQALHEYKVIFFRDQPMTPEQHIAFAKRFGELEIHPFIPSNTAQPELVRFEKSAEVAGFENSWHHDVTWRPQPSMGAVLHGISIPALGGDTLFSDMYAAYESLDDETKELIENLDAVHDYTQAFGRFVPEEQRAQMRVQHPAVTHPVVCTHAATGRRHLYVNRVFVSHIDGMDADESRALIDRLCRQADAPEHQCRFQWEPDSIAFWDNRAVQHYAASDYWPAIRVMERASIIGPRPAR